MSISNSFLPDELWRRILEIGIKTSGFRYKDLCSISISCRRLHRLSNENSLWSHLLSSDFPSSSSSSSSSTTKSSTKTLYRERYFVNETGSFCVCVFAFLFDLMVFFFFFFKGLREIERRS